MRAVKTALERNRDRILRICWETNGSMDEKLLDRCVDTAFVTGGCIKFDLKAWDESLHIALTGVANKRTLANFKRAARRAGKRPVPPLVIAKTLLVPGYVDENEIRSISRSIASIDPRIPYSLLGCRKGSRPEKCPVRRYPSSRVINLQPGRVPVIPCSG